MMQEESAGISVLCDYDGIILRVIRDELGLNVEEGMHFRYLVSEDSVDKAENFLAMLRLQSAVFDWEFYINVNNSPTLVYLAGGSTEGRFLIVGSQSRSGIIRFYGEMMKINNEQTTALRKALKNLSLQATVQALRDKELYDELTRLNNELITLQRRMAKKLETSEERYHLLAEHSSDLISRHSIEGTFLYASPAAKPLLGYEPKELLGHSVYEFFHPCDLEEQGRELFSVGTPGRETYTLQYRIRKKDGQYIWFETTNQAICNPDTRQIHEVISVSRDITERKNAEVELREAKEKAELASQAKSAFLATMSHEIRTPLHGIIGMTELLGDMIDEKEERSYVNIIRDSANLLLSIMNDVLDFSKIEAEKVDLEQYTFDLHNLIEDIKKIIEPKAKMKGLTFATHFDQTTPRLFRGDARRLHQILMNLLSNAIKFTARGYVQLETKLQEQDKLYSTIRFEVSDSGIGISEEMQQRLFNPFTQADSSTTRKYGGTGLGLAITKRLVEIMGGQIGTQSIQGEGATFWVSLPLLHEQEEVLLKTTLDSDRKEMPFCEEESLQDLLAGRSILLAEDNKVNQKLALMQLKKLGVVTHIVNNGREAVEALSKNQYAAILMDCQMPMMDGYEATGIIREMEAIMGRYTPIIAVTARALVGDREQCIRSGMDDYLCKPVKLEELRKVLTQWLKKKKGISEKAMVEKEGNQEKSAITVTKEDELVNNLELNKDEIEKNWKIEEILDLRSLRDIHELAMDSEPEFLQQVIGMYLEDTQPRIEALRQAVTQKDCYVLEKVAHSMKSSSASLGALALSEQCAYMENLGRKRVSEGLEESLEKLLKEFEKTQWALGEIATYGSDKL
ncbi:hybrid sensor histidine kinase/response regulator [Heliorestis convoluta]|uniref:Circadian input-output histidine kinase CikA n=1 Tax=Heliorestis convoluta TaxID=356322 RepID=A0A5Q2N055_9FIRM|nr:PAS domain-containing hybrid sensor histidine kinase/response regulator [Heliorestis convoluta]QGG47149.1 signal transduction histidine kinase [Heliorestis convoluta]